LPFKCNLQRYIAASAIIDDTFNKCFTFTTQAGGGCVHVECSCDP
jgi:hypothetical protein